MIISLIVGTVVNCKDKKSITDFYKKNKDSIDRLQNKLKEMKLYKQVNDINNKILAILKSLNFDIKKEYIRGYDFNGVTTEDDFFKDLTYKIMKTKQLEVTSNYYVTIIPKNPKPEMYDEFEDDDDYLMYSENYFTSIRQALKSKLKTIKTKSPLLGIKILDDGEDGGWINNDDFTEDYEKPYPFTIGFGTIIDFNQIMKESNISLSNESLDTKIYLANSF